jgi:hypothetical protein
MPPSFSGNECERKIHQATDRKESIGCATEENKSGPTF